MCKSRAGRELREFQLTQEGLITLSKASHIPMLHVYDKMYWHVSLADARLLIAEVVPSMPKYEKERVDCNNMASIFHGRFVEWYGINTMGLVSIPALEHMINLFPAEVAGWVRLYFVEPQSGHVEPLVNAVGWKAGEWWMF